jgi:hypothetical protein
MLGPSVPATPSTRLTAGPAAATRNSCQYLRGIVSSEARPPMIMSVMSRTRHPKARAMRLCPSSCRVIDAEDDARENALDGRRTPDVDEHQDDLREVEG